MKCKSLSFREGAKIIGIYAATRGGKHLFARKMKGRRLSLRKKMTGPALFLTKNMTGIDFFLAEITFTAFVLLMLSCLTLDADVFILKIFK